MPRARPLQCPFCENYLIAPIDIKFRDLELTGGICKCGGVYVLDRTGHNMGEIFMDALTFVCKGDIDKSLSLDPSEYESLDYDYDLDSNTVGGRSKTGKLSKLIFVRLTESTRYFS